MNYQQGEVVELASDYKGIDLKENSFFVNSSSGSLEIQNSRDKVISYGDALWGGIGGNDSMQVGNGYDEFFYAVGGGDDVIQNANNNDLINLASVNLSQIAEVNGNIGEVTINFIDGGNLRVQGDSSVGYQVAEGTFQVNQSTGQWTNK